MARQRKEETTEVSKASDDISRFRLGEIGNTGIPIFNGVSYNELKKELTHPESIKTYKLMEYHPAINAPLNLYASMVSKARYRFVAPKDATEEEKRQTEIIESMFGDMEHSLEDFIAESMTCTTYGWSICEKVFRKRTFASGSLYDDGLIGIRKLPLRAQESIDKFIFDASGNELLGVKQNLQNAYDPYGRWASRKETDVVIPRSKFLLFNLGKQRNNPYGTSPLKNAFSAWRYLQALEELEAQSVTKDVNGLPVLSIPPQYLSADASPEQKAILENFKSILRNLQQGSQSAVILPNAYDPDTRNPLFKLELLSQDGKKNFDLNAIKEYYRTMIFTALGADVLLLGSTQAGSFALGSLKNSLTAATAESFIKRIVQVINDDLIRQLYELNGFDPARRCRFDYEDMEEIDLETLSKAYQRLGATGYLPKTLDVINRGLDALGIDSLPETTTQDQLDEMLPEKTTRSSEGMESGMPSGTGSADGSSGNASDINSDNKS
jgi:hypothetical protein